MTRVLLLVSTGILFTILGCSGNSEKAVSKSAPAVVKASVAPASTSPAAVPAPTLSVPSVGQTKQQAWRSDNVKDGTESAGAGSAAGEVLAGATDAFTTAGALFETAFSEFPEQPKIVNSMPVDTNKRTLVILVSSQTVRRLSKAQCFKFEVLCANLE